MKIVVPIKRVATLDDEIELRDDKRGIDPDSADWSLNEWDSFSLEAAAQLREQSGSGEVVVVTVGGPESDETLRGALARGADRAVRVWDEVLEDADPLAVALALARVVAAEGPELVLCGVQSSDAAHGATGVALAGHLGWARVSVVRAFELEPDSESIVAERELDGGSAERVRVRLPALLTIQTGLNEPRYANLRAIKQAAAIPIVEQTLGDLGLDAAAIDAASGSSVARMRPPDPTAHGELIEGDATTVAEQIAAIVGARLGR
jgi:electron transfer flavoprotein beta subunit